MCHFFVTSFCLYSNMEPKEWIKKRNYLRTQDLDRLIHQAQREEMKMLKGLSQKEVFDYMVSKLNFCHRKGARSFRDIDPQFYLHKGDICFIDFGQAYLMEIGYLHFGLILGFKHNKAFVVPMTGKSNTNKAHLYDLGSLPGLNKASCLFLNDAKWINTARIIDVKGHIDPKGAFFKKIKKSVVQCIGLE